MKIKTYVVKTKKMHYQYYSRHACLNSAQWSSDFNRSYVAKLLDLVDEFGQVAAIDCNVVVTIQEEDIDITGWLIRVVKPLSPVDRSAIVHRCLADYYAYVDIDGKEESLTAKNITLLYPPDHEVTKRYVANMEPLQKALAENKELQELIEYSCYAKKIEDTNEQQS